MPNPLDRYSDTVQTEGLQKLGIFWREEVFDEFLEEEVVLLLPHDLQHCFAHFVLMAGKTCDEICGEMVLAYEAIYITATEEPVSEAPVSMSRYILTLHIVLATCGTLLQVSPAVHISTDTLAVTHSFQDDTIAIAVNDICALHTQESGLFQS